MGRSVHSVHLGADRLLSAHEVNLERDVEERGEKVISHLTVGGVRESRRAEGSLKASQHLLRTHRSNIQSAKAFVYVRTTKTLSSGAFLGQP